MTLLDTMLSRRSIRNYTGEPLSKEDLDKILQAGLSSPSGKGLYPWELIVVQDRKMLDKLSHCRVGASAMLKSAAAAIVVVSDEKVADTWVEDGSIVMSNMHLMAHALGLGSCWIQGKGRCADDGTTTDDFVRGLLGYPVSCRLVAVLSVGHPDQRAPKRTREELHWNKVHREKY